MSIWYERQWRFDDGTYGFAGDRRVQANTDLYWLYAGLSYAWTTSGNQFTLALTAGESENADRFNTWRVIARYGYGFNVLRDGQEGAHSVGLLYQYNFEQRKHRKEAAKRT